MRLEPHLDFKRLDVLAGGSGAIYQYGLAAEKRTPLLEWISIVVKPCPADEDGTEPCRRLIK